MRYTFKQMLLDKSKYSIKAPYSMTAHYITVHNTANNASAANEVKYHNGNNNQVSYHVAIDDREVIQCIPFTRNAFHAGDGAHGTGNRKSIGIEICYSKSGGKRYKQAEENAVQYIALLLHERGWCIDRVKKHQDWSGNTAPHRILDEDRWESFKKRVQVALDELKQPKVLDDAEETKEMFVLNETTKADLAKLFKQAHLDGVFTTDHSTKLDSYSDEKLFNLYFSYQIRKELWK